MKALTIRMGCLCEVILSLQLTIIAVLSQTAPTPPRLSLPYQLADNHQWAWPVEAQSGWFCTLQTSLDLSHWQDLTSLFADTGQVIFMTPSSAASTNQFFRAKLNVPNVATIGTYNRWTNAIFLNNGLVEAVIIPSAGRVLQFRFLGETNGPFWENPSLYGQKATSSSWNSAGGFGGDKAWPSPQSDWNWPPPVGFDGSTNAYAITNGIVTLITPVDATYKIRASRRIELAFNEPVMRITTVFERTAATSLTNRSLGVWVITQTKDPVKVYVPLPAPSLSTNGYVQLGTGLPAQYQNTNGFISFSRDTKASHKLGFDAGTLIWIGTNLCLRIDCPRVSGLARTAYPDSGSSVEAYTNPDPAAYVELELLGPLAKLPVGEHLELQTIYTLFHRQEALPDAEAIRVRDAGKEGL